MNSSIEEFQDVDYPDAMAKLNATLQRAEALDSNNSVASSVERDPFVPVELETDYDRGALLPSVEEVKTLNQMDMPLTHTHNRRSDKRDNISAPTVYSRNNWKVAVLALVAGLTGTILGLVLGFRQGEDYTRLSNEANQGNSPTLRPSMPFELAPTYLVVDVPEPPPVNIPASDKPTDLIVPSTPTKTRVKEVQQWLVDQGVSSQKHFDDKESPQYKASKWIADEDEAQIPLPDIDDLYYESDLSENTKDHFIERYIVSLFWFGTNWSEWYESFEFCSKSSVCLWRRKITTHTPNNLTFQEKNLGVSCDIDGRIDAINMPSNNLQGSLMSEIGQLSKLKHIALNHNALTGVIPEDLSELTALTYLALHYNNLQGTLNPSISNLTDLEVLGLGDNSLIGTIPAEWAKLSKVITLGLDNNSLDGALDILESMLQIKRVYLNSNNFNQDITQISWDLLQDLQELDLASNRLVGTIPDALLALPKLQVLSLNNNQIDGNLPTQYPPISTLRYLTLSDNNIGGSIDKSLSKLDSLVHLDLSANMLTGDLPHQLSSLVNLEYLFLSRNEQLNAGGIPHFLEKLTNLRDLSLSLTNRVGQIPGNVLEKLSNLVLFDVGINDLSSEIPSQISNLTKLKYLILNRNYDLDGTVPEGVQLLPALDILMVDRTSVNGTLNPLCNNEHKAVIVGSNCQISEPKMECECCNICCGRDDNATCHDTTYFGKLNPSWEYSFQRKQYEFDAEIFDIEDDDDYRNDLLGGTKWGDNSTLGTGAQPDSIP